MRLIVNSALTYCLLTCTQSARCSHPRLQICFLTRPLDLFLVARLQPGGGCLPLHRVHISWLASHALQSALVPSSSQTSVCYSADHCGALMVFRAAKGLHLCRFQGPYHCLQQGQSLRLPARHSATQTRHTDVTKDPRLSAL